MAASEILRLAAAESFRLDLRDPEPAVLPLLRVPVDPPKARIAASMRSRSSFRAFNISIAQDYKLRAGDAHSLKRAVASGPDVR